MKSWSNLCRCCLSPDSKVSLLNNEDNVKEKFLEVTSIQVKEDDGLPQKLCLECFSIMTSAYHFRTQCMKMDKELKVQLDAIIKQTKNIISPQLSDTETQVKSNADMTVEDNIAKQSMKELECIIESEPNDDDDYYYVLVIDSPKDKEDKDNDLKKETCENIQEPELMKSIKQKVDTNVYESSLNKKSLPEVSQFETSFLVSNPLIPVNVPATISKNKEQDNESQYEMDIDATQETEEQELSFVQNEELTIIEKPLVTIVENTPEQSMGDYSIALTEKDVGNSKYFIKILSPLGSEKAVFLKDDEGIKYLTDAQLSKSTDILQEQEVIFCEGEDASQFQILKCDGSEVVIEYTDESQTATVLQQEDGTFLFDRGEHVDDFSQYKEHQYKQNSAGDFLCNFCGKGFDTPEILAGHMVLHSVTTAFVKCLFCNQLINRKSLIEHVKYVHNSKPKCNVCLKTFDNQTKLKRHMMSHKEFECDICQKRFGKIITMQTHRLTHINPYVCNQCGSLFETKESLAVHKDSEQCSKSKVQKVNKVKKELIKTVKQEVATNLDKLLDYHACFFCKKQFSLESALEQHIESTHIERFDVSLDDQSLNRKAAKKFPCNICGKGFTCPAMLIRHERVHTNERPFPCQLCSLQFKTKTHLKTHQLTHTREKKFGCSVCMKFFALKGNLVAHIRTHTGERPYVCHLCNEAFIDSKYLKRHKLKKHTLDNLPWNQYCHEGTYSNQANVECFKQTTVK